MKAKSFISIVFLFVSLASCDVQSEIAKKSVEKYAPTPTPSISPTPDETPVNPADTRTADTTLQGDTVSVNDPGEKRRAICDKYNRVMVNNSGTVVTVKGVCRQILINGGRNDITVEAAAEVIFNGDENTVRYSHYANGKRPTVSDNGTGNTTEKFSAGGTK